LTDFGRLGVSVDIGTTNITIHLTNLTDNSLIKEITVTNPQRQYGEEIISRIDFARDSENASVLTRIVRESINDGISRILKESECSHDSVDSVVVVGNTVMHHLFFGLSTDSLLKPPYTTEQKNSILVKSAEIGLDLHDDTTCYSPALVESFVGADAVAMMIASGFVDSDTSLVSIDVGTNTEIAALNEGEIWVASAASGPAFEGMSIECGTPGDEGAISRVLIDPRDFRPEYEVIGGVKPTGICGTGVISAIAGMLDTGILFSRGSFNRSRQTPWLVTDTSIIHYIIASASESTTNSNIVLTQPDVRMLQQSKASIRSALELVLHRAHLEPVDVDTLYLTGVFGSGLVLDDAIRIGLLPEMVNANVKQVVGGASLGADLLHKPEFRQHAEKIASGVNHIELTNNPEFKEKFTKNLRFP
jgi:uncharacterized 2Fe-2S/4Fe-4S cluster protein (DUF4445 family)